MRTKRLLALILIFGSGSLAAQDGESVYIVRPSAEQRFPEAPATAPPTPRVPEIAIQPRIPPGWHLQILTEATSLEEAAAQAERVRPMFGDSGLYIIVKGNTFRISVGPLVPRKLQPTLNAARGGGFTGAVLRRQD